MKPYFRIAVQYFFWHRYLFLQRTTQYCTAIRMSKIHLFLWYSVPIFTTESPKCTYKLPLVLSLLRTSFDVCLRTSFDGEPRTNAHLRSRWPLPLLFCREEGREGRKAKRASRCVILTCCPYPHTNPNSHPSLNTNPNPNRFLRTAKTCLVADAKRRILWLRHLKRSWWNGVLTDEGAGCGVCVSGGGRNHNILFDEYSYVTFDLQRCCHQIKRPGLEFPKEDCPASRLQAGYLNQCRKLQFVSEVNFQVCHPYISNTSTYFQYGRFLSFPFVAMQDLKVTSS